MTTVPDLPGAVIWDQVYGAGSHQSSSAVFSHSVMSDSLGPHGLQQARLPYLSLSPGVHSNSCPSSWWCHPTTSSSATPFSSCPQSFPASGSSPMSLAFFCIFIFPTETFLSDTCFNWLSTCNMLPITQKGHGCIFSILASKLQMIDHVSPTQ